MFGGRIGSNFRDIFPRGVEKPVRRRLWRCIAVSDGFFDHSPQVHTHQYVLHTVSYGRNHIIIYINSMWIYRSSRFIVESVQLFVHVVFWQYYTVSRPTEYFVVHNLYMRKRIETEAKPPYILTRSFGWRALIVPRTQVYIYVYISNCHNRPPFHPPPTTDITQISSVVDTLKVDERVS